MSATMEMLSEAYTEYTRLLRQLHALIRRGEDESVEGDELRDAMDEPWRRLTEPELARVRGLGADLNAIGSENPSPEEAILQELFAYLFSQAQQDQDWTKALSLLRSYPWFFPPDKLLFLKGIFWARLGDFESALVLFEEATNLGSAEPDCVFALLQTLCILGRLIDAIDRIIVISKKYPHLIPPALLDNAKGFVADRQELLRLDRLSGELRMRRIEAEAVRSERVRERFLRFFRETQKGHLPFPTDAFTRPEELAVFAA